MKHTKKLFAIALTLIMALALTVPAFAATINVTGAVKGQTYNAYKIFDVTTTGEYGQTGTGYAYKISSSDEWFAEVVDYMEATADANGAYTGKGITLTPTTTSGVYNVSVNLDSAEGTVFSAADFAKDLATKTTGKTVDGTAESGDATTTINVTDAGYYFIDSELGALCSLQTSDAVVDMVEKNSVPTLAKAVAEDSKAGKADEYGATATADIGQTVNFKLTVNTGSNSAAASDNDPGVDKNYVITDTLPAGMSYVANSAAITGWTVGADMTAADTDFTVDYTNDVLTITLKAETVREAGKNVNIIITYNAKVDTDAVVGGTGNENTAKLTYGVYETTEVNATVYTYKTSFLKYTLDSTTETPLANAKFSLSKNDDGSNALTFTQIDTVNGVAVTVPTYMYDYSVTGNITEITTDSNGVFEIVGLDADTYYMTETAAPDGYNKLIAPVTIVIDEDGTVTQDGEDATTVKILNESGVLLVTKKRMADEE